MTDGDQSILSDFEISVLDADGKEVWTHRQYDFPDPMALITVGSVNGRSVKVQLNGKGSLKLAEVLVECAETVQDHDANSE